MEFFRILLLYLLSKFVNTKLLWSGFIWSLMLLEIINDLLKAAVTEMKNKHRCTVLGQFSNFPIFQFSTHQQRRWLGSLSLLFNLPGLFTHSWSWNKLLFSNFFSALGILIGPIYCYDTELSASNHFTITKSNFHSKTVKT